MLSEPIAVTLLVIDALEALNVPYLIGGSFAAAVYGVARMTADADLVADVRFEHVEPLSGRLSAEFYLDVESIREAIRLHSSFSLIHFKTMFKVDVFLLKPRPYSQQQMERRVLQQSSASSWGNLSAIALVVIGLLVILIVTGLMGDLIRGTTERINGLRDGRVLAAIAGGILAAVFVSGFFVWLAAVLPID